MVAKTRLFLSAGIEKIFGGGYCAGQSSHHPTRQDYTRPGYGHKKREFNSSLRRSGWIMTGISLAMNLPQERSKRELEISECIINDQASADGAIMYIRQQFDHYMIRFGTVWFSQITTGIDQR
ncbi:hypothetical protein CHS0354_001933, partial [Potamilus streckersoni]